MLVQESVAESLVELLVEKTIAVKFGDPFDPMMDMGTVIDEASARRFETVVNEAVAGGARSWSATAAAARCTRPRYSTGSRRA